MTASDFSRDFIAFACEKGVLRFGEFKTKAGRLSPYFFNAGLFDDGASLGRLCDFYARAIQASGIGFDMLFGPAYKGIPLAAGTAIEMARRGRNVPFCFNRKEAKDHGEGGTLVGTPVVGRALIVDDVITAGTAIREVMQIVQAAGAQATGVLVALDRQEKGKGDLSAIQEVERDFGLAVYSIVSLAELIEFLREEPSGQVDLERIDAYRLRYGVGG